MRQNGASKHKQQQEGDTTAHRVGADLRQQQHAASENEWNKQRPRQICANPMRDEERNDESRSHDDGKEHNQEIDPCRMLHMGGTELYAQASEIEEDGLVAGQQEGRLQPAIVIGPASCR